MAAIGDAIRQATTKRILTIDIERLPGLTPIFDQRTRGFIPVTQWSRLPALLCFAAKWHNTRSIEFEAAWSDQAAMVQRSWELYDQADIVVTYNGVGFDNKHLRTEWLLAGFPPPRPWKNVDLYRVNRQQFGFESKSLNHLCHRLGLPTKAGRYDPFAAEQCMNGDVPAQRLMKRYNIGDVKITEACYDRLLPWISNHPHVAAATALNDGRVCNKCGSADLQPVGTYDAVVMAYAMYRCNTCKGLVRAGHVRRIASTRGIQ